MGENENFKFFAVITSHCIPEIKATIITPYNKEISLTFIKNKLSFKNKLPKKGRKKGIKPI